MKYLPQNKIKEYREQNMPKKCPIFKVKMNYPVLDHCHRNYKVRGVIDNYANLFLGKIENAFDRFGKSSDLSLTDVLRNVIIYLENKQPDILHPVGFRQMTKHFKNQSKDRQIILMKQEGIEKEDIFACQNAHDRISLYRITIKEKCKNI
jgi:hypothetical protein